jgi:hypothetical protein
MKKPGEPTRLEIQLEKYPACSQRTMLSGAYGYVIQHLNFHPLSGSR